MLIPGASRRQPVPPPPASAPLPLPRLLLQAPLLVYVRPDDEFLAKQATASATFAVEGRAVAKDELLPMRMVMLVPAAKLPAAR